VSGPLHTVHVRINDAATGQPTPVRLRITDPEGTYYPPFGRLAEFATGPNQDVGGNLRIGGKAYAIVDGTCEVRLPAGPLLVEIAKGPEYTARQEHVSLGVGKIALRFTLERSTDLRGTGWFAGDTRAHFLTPHAALLEGAAEDLAVVNLLATECEMPGPEGKSYTTIPSLLAFSGQDPALEMAGHLVAVNTHNCHPVLGSLALLNCHRVIYPLRFGGPRGLDDWLLTDWCDQCHRKGGLVIWTQTDKGPLVGGEALADVILGKVDAIELAAAAGGWVERLGIWYALLGCGFRIPLVGASGKESNALALGSLRTYARLPARQALTYREWIEAVRAGRTIATTGPLLRFTADGANPGALMDRWEGVPVRIRAEAHSQTPFGWLEIVANGAVIARAEAAGSPALACLETEWLPGSGGWLAARCVPLPGAQAPGVVPGWAHTAPIYIHTGYVTSRGERVPTDSAAAALLLEALEGSIRWVEGQDRFSIYRQRNGLQKVLHSARRELRLRAGMGGP
jgi:hypothetical protein